MEGNCMSIQTYNNIRQQHFGFFFQARIDLFNSCKHLNFFPMLHSTQSRLEAKFSKSRARNLDSSFNYGVGVKYRSQRLCLNKSASYNYEYDDIMNELSLDTSSEIEDVPENNHERKISKCKLKFASICTHKMLSFRFADNSILKNYRIFIQESLSQCSVTYTRQLTWFR